MNAAAISTLIDVVLILVDKIGKLIAISKQTGELTAQQEADFGQRLTSAFEAPHWKSRRKGEKK